MNILPISQLFTTQYTVKSLKCLSQNWKQGSTWHCVQSPKQDHLFLYFKTSGAIYEYADGTQIRAQTGDLVYTPKGSEYRIYFFDGAPVQTVGIRFGLYDAQGNETALSSSPCLFSKSERIEMLFNQAERLQFSTTPVPVKLDVIVYSLISDLGERASHKNEHFSNFQLIQKGVEYLTQRLNEETSIDDLAKMCNVSSVYFRKLFKRLTGLSPSQYRIRLRVAKARDYLQYGEYSVTEIGEILGYMTTTYFIKQFKRETGCTPLHFRNANKL